MLKCVMSRKLVFILIPLLVLNSLFLLSASGEARPFFGRTIQLTPQTVAPGKGRIVIDFIVPEHHEFAYEAPSTILTRFKDSSVFKTTSVKKKPTALDLSELPHTINYEASEGQTVVVIDLRAHFCDKDSKICLTDSMRVKFALTVKENAPAGFSIKIPLEAKSFS